jgi:uncharacterized repeat protein (TIGR03803 family)
LTPQTQGDWALQTLYTFGAAPDGSQVNGGLVFDTASELYGTTFNGGAISNYGTIYRLTGAPNPGDQWEETILHNFDWTEGAYPLAELLRVGTTLYGTTWAGGTYGNGVVFRLTPPSMPNGAWNYSVLHHFTGGADGGRPVAPMVLGPDGFLYSTTRATATIFRLVPPAPGESAWTEQVLYTFPDQTFPTTGVVIDAKGSLYGMAYAASSGLQVKASVFKLSPPAVLGQPWTLTLLHTDMQYGANGNDFGNLLLGPQGGIYGTELNGGSQNCSYGCGEIFELRPPEAPGGTWRRVVLHSFQGGAEGGNPPGVSFGAGGTSLIGTASAPAGLTMRTYSIFEIMQ